jgi:hypothetical protein
VFPLLVEDSLLDGPGVPAGDQGGRLVRRIVGLQEELSYAPWPGPGESEAGGYD